MRKLERVELLKDYVQQAVDRGAWLADGAIWANIDGTVERIDDADVCPSARYPYPENLLSAVVAARSCGLAVRL